MTEYRALVLALQEWRNKCVIRYGAGQQQINEHYDMLRDYRADLYSREWAVFIGCPELAPAVS